MQSSFQPWFQPQHRVASNQCSVCAGCLFPLWQRNERAVCVWNWLGQLHHLEGFVGDQLVLLQKDMGRRRPSQALSCSAGRPSSTSGGTACRNPLPFALLASSDCQVTMASSGCRGALKHVFVLECAQGRHHEWRTLSACPGFALAAQLMLHASVL